MAITVTAIALICRVYVKYVPTINKIKNQNKKKPNKNKSTTLVKKKKKKKHWDVYYM